MVQIQKQLKGEGCWINLEECLPMALVYDQISRCAIRTTVFCSDMLTDSPPTSCLVHCCYCWETLEAQV